MSVSALIYRFLATSDNLALDDCGGKKKIPVLLQGGLHVIEELEAVAKFSELRENQRLNV